MNTDYTIALYMRLSLEDENTGESNSIKNQRELLTFYVKQSFNTTNTNILQFFDDGYSGVNFERPAVKQMLNKVRNGEINCIIVKDISRFGRNYIEVGDYLEQLFPFMNVRFISVNDNYDSNSHNGEVGNLDIAFKNLIYDFYSKDLSQKIKTAKYTKMRKGEYISSYAIYGYKCLKGSKRTLVIDEEPAKIVKRIYELITSGLTTTRIAQILNAENIPTPSVYKNNNNCKRKWHKVRDNNFWTNTMVWNIIIDERYTGKTINGKHKRIEVGNQKVVSIAKSDWIVCDNTHEPIVSDEIYPKALYCLKYPPKKPVETKKQRLLYEKVKCGCCKYTMKRSNSKTPVYQCLTNKFISSPDCVKEKVSETLIEEVLLTSIQCQVNLVLKKDKTISMLAKKSKEKSINNMDKIKNLQKTIESLEQSKMEFYEEYNDGKISREDFIQKKKVSSSQIEQLEIQIKELEEIIQYENQQKTPDNPVIESLKKNQVITGLSRELIDELVESIMIYDSEHINIIWRFNDYYMGIYR